MSEKKIHGALDTAARAALALASISTIAGEGKDATPPNGATWARISLLRAGSPPASLGVGGQDEHRGILQIDLNYPQGGTAADPLGNADTIAGYLKAGARFTYQSQDVVVESCNVGDLRRDGAWLRLVMTINWVAFTTR